MIIKTLQNQFLENDVFKKAVSRQQFLSDQQRAELATDDPDTTKVAPVKQKQVTRHRTTHCHVF